MNKDFLYIQLLFLGSIIITLFVNDNLFLKILLLVLLGLFVILQKPNYKHNLNKYLYHGYGFVIILFLFILIEYINNFYYLLFVIIAIVIFYYLSKVIFKYTFGEVIKKKKDSVDVKIQDIFFKRKTYNIKTRKNIQESDKVLLILSRVPFFRKPLKIKKVIK